ncbi:MAG: DUF192 domain-containing protein [Proteobacteria bacterium]|nr:DUF192 domain-containing protein [Pseudomonadota bacterium]
MRVRVADTFITRGLGLLVGTPLEAAEGLLIAPCSSIHTFGMRYAIDVVFIDRDARIVRVCPDVKAGRARFAGKAHAVLELRAGVAAQQGLTAGVRLEALAPVLAAKPS